jgi:hypothetical protein
MKHQPVIIRHEMQLAVTVTGHRPYVLTVPFSFNPRRPFAIDFDCSTEHGKSEWRCDRETLAGGRDKQVVDPSEDVIVRPSVVNGAPSVFIILRPDLPEVATLTVSRLALDPFIDAAFKAVPRGRELKHLDWRAALDELTGASA